MRGDVYRIKAPNTPRGNEQQGARLAVAVQSDDLPLSTWLVAPASAGRRAASFRPEITVAGTRARVIVEQVTAVDPRSRLGEFIGRVSPAELAEIDEALRVVLGLDA